MKRYRIEIDRSLCSGFGACEELAPQLFQVGTDGVALALADSDDAAVLEAADACPMGAISVIELDREAA